MAFRPSNQAQVLAFRRWGDSPAASVEVVHAAPEEVQEPVDVDALIAEAFERGRAEGRAAVEEEVAEERASLEGVQEALIAVAEEIEGLRHATLAQSADDVAQLVLLFARRVVDRSLALHPEALPALVMEAVQQLPNRENVSISVAPHLAERLTRSLPGELRDRVVADPEVDNGAVVKTRHVSIEATLAHATEGLEGAVRNWLSEQWWAVGDGEFG
jgi:flagellar biosynthesis/type III secretory pathway protein FliH